MWRTRERVASRAKLVLAALAALGVGFSPGPAAAQIYQDYQVNIWGYPLSCVAWNGRPVLIEINPYIPNVGLASPRVDGQPLIQLNPNVMLTFSPMVAQWWFAHECGHLALPPGGNGESAADCYGVQRMVQLGMISDVRQLEAFSFELQFLRGSPVTGHLPGPIRAQNIKACALS